MSPEPPRGAVDWAVVRRRVEAARHATERGWAPPPEEQQRILRERARALAASPLENAAAAALAAVEFTRGAERYALELPFVREVYPLRAFTPLPCTPAFVYGLVNVRGQILSVIDLGRFFELPEERLTDDKKVVIVGHGEMEFGILADEVPGIVSIPCSELRSSLPTLTGIREKYLRGVTPERLVVLDGARLLAERGLVVNEHVEG